MKIKKKILYIFFASFFDLIQNSVIYVGDDGVQNEELGTFQNPFHNISYALDQINNSFNNVEIMLLENVNENDLSGNFSFRDTNITVK